jgi:hypothetical protein
VTQASKIAKSQLKPLVKGIPEEAEKGGKGGQEQMVQNKFSNEQKQEDGKTKVNRDAWNAIGETASTILVDHAGGGMVGQGDGAGMQKKDHFMPGKGLGNPRPGVETKGLATQAMPRTEFVLLFVWREPLAAAPVAVADDKK